MSGGGYSQSEQQSRSRQQSSSVQQAESKTPEQKEWLSRALGLYGPTVGTGEPSYAGERLARFTPIQEQALGATAPFLEGAFSPDRETPLSIETGEALRKTLTGETGAQPITSEQTKAYFEDFIKKPAQAAYTKEVKPAVREAFAGPGFFGSARAKAQAESGENLFRYLGEKKSELDWNALMSNRAAEESRAARTAGAVPLGIEFGAAPTREAQARLGGRQQVFDFATAEQAQEQAMINDAVTRFAEENRLTGSENLAIIMGLLGLNFASSSGISQGLGTASSSGRSVGFNVGF